HSSSCNPSKVECTCSELFNLIGEQTYYYGGFVLPLALPHTMTAAAARRDDGQLRLRSLQSVQVFEGALAELVPGSVTGWAAYPAGTLWALTEAGHRLGGLDLLVDSTEIGRAHV